MKRLEQQPTQGATDPAYLEDSASALLKPLIDPAMLSTLGDRGANSRVQKITAILWDAKMAGLDTEKTAGDAFIQNQ